MKALSLLYVSLPVRDLSELQDFYVAQLGFSPCGPAREADPVLAGLLGSRRIREVRLRRHRQVLELRAHDPEGDAYPLPRGSNDLCLQHLALVTDDMVADYARLAHVPHETISRGGPQTLPGGIVAYKFRDPDGHPMELIQFPAPRTQTAGGIDHTAISVSDAVASIAFYADALGLRVAAHQVNEGAAQDSLDGLNAAKVDVVALAPARSSPHIELLCYRHPPGRLAPSSRPCDLAASQSVLLVDDLSGLDGVVTLADGTRAALIHDPDGHALLLRDGIHMQDD